MDGNRSTVDSDAALAVAPATQQYVGRWNQLVSTTNWEKGRIIIQWRDALSSQMLRQVSIRMKLGADLLAA